MGLFFERTMENPLEFKMLKGSYTMTVLGGYMKTYELNEEGKLAKWKNRKNVANGDIFEKVYWLIIGQE